MAEDKDSNSKGKSPDKADEKKNEQSEQSSASVAAKASQPGKQGSNAAPANENRKHKQPPILKEPAIKTSLKAQKKNTQKSGRGLAWFATLLAILSIGAVGYTYWQFEQYKGIALVSAKDSEQRAYERLQRETSALKEELAAHSQEAQGQQRAISELRDRIAAARRQIGEITHVSRRSWMLAEAEYLLRLANQRLIMEQETTSAFALLKAADQILLETDDINLHQVRAAIAEEMAALRATDDLDMEGTFFALAALVGQLKDLPLILPRTEEVHPVEESDNKFIDALAKLESLVTIRHRNKPAAPLLPPEQHYYVQQNLRLMLEQAQLALLQRRPMLYAQSLEKAEQWVQDYFEFNQSSTTLVESIGELKQLQIAPQMPDISRSLALLKSYLSNPELALGESAGVQQ